MRYFILGGTGFVGSFLIKFILEQGEHVTALVRDEAKIKTRSPKLELVNGDPLKEGEWQKQMAISDVIINLVGSPIMTDWTDKAKKNILSSRVDSTVNVVNALKDIQAKTFICANAVGYFGSRGDELIDDYASPGKNFLADVCLKWQDAAVDGEKFGHRVVVTRFPAVLGPGGGALAEMMPVFKLGLGGRLGSGKQWFPWVHMFDLARAIYFISQKKEFRGPVNVCSPKPVTNAHFTKALAKAVKRPALLAVPGFALRIRFGEVANMLLIGQRCIPRKLHDAGFEFKFEDIESALANILAEWS